MTSKTSSSTHHTMMSSSTEPSSLVEQMGVLGPPGPDLAEVVGERAWSRSKAPAPSTRTVPRWLTSNATASVRHARCSAMVPVG